MDDRITVQELIELLQKYQPTARVCFDSKTHPPRHEGTAYELFEITERRIRGDTDTLIIITTT